MKDAVKIYQYPDISHWRQLKKDKSKLKPLAGNGFKQNVTIKSLQLQVEIHVEKAAIKRCGIPMDRESDTTMYNRIPAARIIKKQLS